MPSPTHKRQIIKQEGETAHQAMGAPAFGTSMFSKQASMSKNEKAVESPSKLVRKKSLRTQNQPAAPSQNLGKVLDSLDLNDLF